MLVLDREDKEQVLTCSKNDGVYQWTTAGGLHDYFALGHSSLNSIYLLPFRM